jgi:hypothetical protein
MSVVNRGTWRGYALGFPTDWAVDADEDALVALLPPDDGGFVSNLVLNPTGPGPHDPVAGIAELPGSVLLSVRRVTSPFPADEVVFGYPLWAAAVTVVRLIGSPEGGEPIVATFSAAADRFGPGRDAVESALAGIEVLS